ncbi:MAG: hypothetical protein F6J98_42325 [Moorea sp. SIO4G2]|nr:hypothetical protein [Moorena sp. SIO4G2]
MATLRERRSLLFGEQIDMIRDEIVKLSEFAHPTVLSTQVGWANRHDSRSYGITFMICPPYA